MQEINKKILITGAAGFLGSALLNRLSQESNNVHALTRTKETQLRLSSVCNNAVQVHSCDISDYDALACLFDTIKPDLVFHLAAKGGDPSKRNCDALFKDNIVAAQNIIRLILENGNIRLVYTASSLEQKRGRDVLDECSALEPVNMFAAYKASSTLLIQSAARIQKQDVVIVRPFSIYGPGEPLRRLIPSAIRAGLTGAVLPLTQDVLRRDFVYIDDVVQALLLASRSKATYGEVFNIASGRSTSNQEVVATISKALGEEIKIDVGAYPPHLGDSLDISVDNSKAKNLLSWSPTHTFEEGIEKTIEWMKDIGVNAF